MRRAKLGGLLAFISVFLALATTVTADSRPAAKAPRYNEVYQKSSHNSYEPPKVTLLNHLADLKIHSLELDLHIGKGPGYPRPNGAWYVYHAYGIADDSSCASFSACLDQLRAWHDRNPAHEVVTVFIDLKDTWDKQHSPADLDRALARALPGAVYGPSTAKAACKESVLRTAVKRCAWPEVATLRGKFMFVLTGLSDQLVTYARSSDAAYIAPEIEAAEDISTFPDAVFFNLNSEHFQVGRDVMTAGFVSRVFYRGSFVVAHGINDVDDWNLAIKNSINHIATDELDAVTAPWARTQNVHGWPFTCRLQDCSAMTPKR